MTRDEHFAGFDDAEDPDAAQAPRSKHEVMKEVIAKSKLAKHERQKVKDADEELRMELDDELGDIRSLLFSRPSTEASVDVAATERAATSASSKGDTYDAFVREMAYERRAKPQDRLKTAEELAQDQAKRLEEAESARLRRMRGELDEEGEALMDYAIDDDDDHENDANSNVKRAVKTDEPRTMRSRFGLGHGLDEQSSAASENDEDAGQDAEAAMEEEYDVDEEEDNESDDDQGDDAEDSEDNDEDGDENDTAAQLADYQNLEQYGEAPYTPQTVNKAEPQPTRRLPRASSEHVSTLPFTFPCPSTHDAFLDLLEQHQVAPSQLHTVISRIRTLHAPNLGEENPVKLQRFLGVLVDHVLYRTSQDDATNEDLLVLNDLVLHISDLATVYPLRAAEHFVAKLSLMQRNLMQGLAQGALEPASRTWPSLPELSFLRVCGLLWPTSDRWHAVTTPMLLLVAQYLAHARIRSLRDMGSALYLVSLVSSAQRESRRIVPEALNALFNISAMLLPLHHGRRMHGRSSVKALAEEFGIPTPDVEAQHTHAFTIRADAQPHAKVSLAHTLTHADAVSSSSSVQTQVDLLRMCVALQMSFAKMYEGSPAFVELFMPMLFLLEIGEAGLRDTAPSVVSYVHDAATSIRSQLERAYASRHALRLQAHRALSIATYAPKFDQQSFDPKRATDPDTERAYAAKMRALLKKERKGAIRELRKDAQFLADEREQRRVAEDVAYKKKIDKIMGGMQDERSEQKQLERAKSAIRKRAGKRSP